MQVGLAALVRLPLRCDVDRRPCLGRFAGVVEQVVDDLLEAIRVEVDGLDLADLQVCVQFALCQAKACVL